MPSKNGSFNVTLHVLSEVVKEDDTLPPAVFLSAGEKNAVSVAVIDSICLSSKTISLLLLRGLYATLARHLYRLLTSHTILAIDTLNLQTEIPPGG